MCGDLKTPPDLPLTPKADLVQVFEQVGGEPVLRSIIRTFVQRMFSDPMIGFLFRQASQERVALSRRSSTSSPTISPT